MIKILYLTSNPSPYRVDFFNEISNMCDLTVIYEKKKLAHRDEKWIYEGERKFKEIYLKGVLNSSLCVSILLHIKKNYDVIIIGGYSTPTGMLAINYLKLKKIPFILNTDGGFIKEDKKITYLIKKYFISSASAWLSTSDITTDYLIHYGAKKDKIYKYPFTSIRSKEILKNPLNIQEKNNIKKSLNIKEEKVIISVGRFIYIKGFDVLLNACKDISKDIGIYIIGGRPTEEYLQLKKNNGLDNIHFIDFMTKNELKQYYMVADLFVLPTRGDVWGLVINEAMSCGVPLITTNKCVAGLELIQDNQNGYIVNVDNESQLREKMIAILEDEGLRHSMSEANIEKIREYTIENMAKTHLDIFSKILKN